MKKLSLLIFLAGFLSFAKATNYADYVNPLVGTQSTFELSTGNTCLLYTSPSPRD